ncbi:hypothetical protein HDU76_007197 [Blyttiomyces sp. JEL0837]|nr:hypothetical protein HDU76_007197 [Blyttiomyces sp. JEL0837]
MTTSNSGSIVQIKSYWDGLAAEIKTIILNHCDLLTQYLNNHLTQQEIETNSVDIWNLAIKFNFQGDFSTLPNKLPNTKNGLANITSRDFYKRLCKFRPDLAGPRILQKFMHKYDDIWWWLTGTEESDQNENHVRKFMDAIPNSSLSNMLLHIPLRQQWMDDYDLREVHDRYEDDMDVIKLWVINGYFGHVGLFKSTLEELLSTPKRFLERMFKITLPQLCNNILWLAVSEGVFEVVELLMDSGIDGIDAGFMENEFIRLASQKGHLDVVTLLLEQDDVNPMAEGYESFSLAAENGHFDVVKVLLESVEGDDDELPDCAKASLYAAALGGFLDIVQYVVELGVVEPGYDGNCLFRAACRRGHVNVANFLLGIEGVNPFDADNEALRMAAKRGHKEIVELLLQLPGIDASAVDNEALRMAALHGHLDIVKLLLGCSGVDASAMDNEAIRSASAEGYYDIVKFLLGVPGVDASALDNEAIQDASADGYHQIVKLLLGAHGVDTTACNNQAIRDASRRGHYEVVKPLLRVQGVDPTACNNQAIRSACIKGHIKVVEELLKVQGVDASANNNEAILVALGKGHVAVVKKLLEVEGVYSSNLGIQLLELAASGGFLDVVKILVEVKGVDASVNDKAALRAARLRRRLDVVQYLECK